MYLYSIGNVWRMQAQFVDSPLARHMVLQHQQDLQYYDDFLTIHPGIIPISQAHEPRVVCMVFSFISWWIFLEYKLEYSLCNTFECTSDRPTVFHHIDPNHSYSQASIEPWMIIRETLPKDGQFFIKHSPRSPIINEVPHFLDWISKTTTPV